VTKEMPDPDTQIATFLIGNISRKIKVFTIRYSDITDL